MRETTYVLLHNVRSAYNVGSIFRTCDAAGVTKLFLSGYTPAPLDRFGRKRTDIAKVALGAEETVSWEYVANIQTCIDTLHQEGVLVVGVEQTEKSIDYRTLDDDKPVAFIFGNEREGVPENVLHCADVVVEIPMHGKKESLNVSVAVGIVLFKD